MPLQIQPIPEDAIGKRAVASVKFIDGTGRWKIQLRHHLTGLFVFTSHVYLKNAEVIVDEGLVRKKIKDPESGHMFIFMAGDLADDLWTPPNYAERINVATREPKTIEDAHFVTLPDRKPLPDFAHFLGDANGHAWVW